MNYGEWIAAGSFVFAVLGYAIKDRLKIQRDNDALKKDVAEVKVNYIQRFADLETKVTEGKTEIITAIGLSLIHI